MSSIKIAVRQRPASPQSPLKIFNTSKDQHTVSIKDPKSSETRSFDFYRVFLETASQEEIFDTLVRPLLDTVMDGNSSCFMTFGQSNSGKSYTSFGEEEFSFETRGVVYRAIETAFEEMSKLTTKEFEVSVTFYELYKEQVRDLGLAYKDGKATSGFKDMNLELIDHQSEVYIAGLSRIPIRTPEDGGSVLRQGWDLRRSVEAREGKYEESTHTFFGLHIHQKDKRGDITTLSTSYLLFVKLANSDKPGRDSDLSEAMSVHRSFTTLSKVISSLGNANPPYRDSKLTRLLQGCLRERLPACLLVTINQSPIFYEESLSSLEFADRCLDLTSILNKGNPAQNEDYLGLAQKDFRIKVLQNELKGLKDKQREMEMQQEKQIKDLQEQLGIKVDIHDLLQAQPGSREHNWLLKQKEAVQRIDGLVRINQELAQKITENKKLFEKIKRLEAISQEQHTREVLKLKDQLLNLKEQLETEKARAQHSARQQLQTRSAELRTMLKHSKALIDEKKEVLKSVPFTMRPMPQSTVNMRDLGKNEMKQKYDKMLTDQQRSHKAHEEAIKAKYEQILTAKDTEAAQLSRQLSEFRESKKLQMQELKSEAMQLYQVIEQQRKVLANIQSGEYNQHLRAVSFPKELVPPAPTPDQFPL